MKVFALFFVTMSLATALYTQQAEAENPYGKEALPGMGIKSNTISWTTLSEKDNFGYDVYRGLSEQGPFEKVSTEPIPGAGTTDIPQRYEYRDEGIRADTIYWYYVESISFSGDRKRFTPVYPSKPGQRTIRK